MLAWVTTAVSLLNVLPFAWGLYGARPTWGFDGKTYQQMLEAGRPVAYIPNIPPHWHVHLPAFLPVYWVVASFYAALVLLLAPLDVVLIWRWLDREKDQHGCRGAHLLAWQLTLQVVALTITWNWEVVSLAAYAAYLSAREELKDSWWAQSAWLVVVLKPQFVIVWVLDVVVRRRVHWLPATYVAANVALFFWVVPPTQRAPVLDPGYVLTLLRPTGFMGAQWGINRLERVLDPLGLGTAIRRWRGRQEVSATLISEIGKAPRGHKTGKIKRFGRGERRGRAGRFRAGSRRTPSSGPLPAPRWTRTSSWS
ncbi:MAG: hypothetical protein Kow0069_20060 [Promethearchaeota archaeon]